MVLAASLLAACGSPPSAVARDTAKVDHLRAVVRIDEHHVQLVAVHCTPGACPVSPGEALASGQLLLDQARLTLIQEQLVEAEAGGPSSTRMRDQLTVDQLEVRARSLLVTENEACSHGGDSCEELGPTLTNERNRAELSLNAAQQRLASIAPR